MIDPQLSDGVYGGRLQQALLTAERYLRTHPLVVDPATVAFFVFVGAVHVHVGLSVPLALTLAGPLALCTYGLGLLVGTTAAVAISVIWLGDALASGGAVGDILLVFATRLFSNCAVVALAAMAATAARARERYVDSQRELGRLRADLMAAFSHDLRAPLTAIMGYADMVRDGMYGAVPPSVHDVLDRILVNASHLNQLIGDMLAAGQSETAVPLQVSRFEPEELLGELRAEFDGAPRVPQVTLAWHIAPHTPRLQTDRSKLMSVVRNLVGNALKFTERGSVTVRIGYSKESAAHRIEVEDTGSGIPPAELPHVFNRFYRANQPKRTEGFGLGLFIVKRFTELLGGSVAVVSQVGRGTCFTVMLPRLQDNAPTAAPLDEQGPAVPALKRVGS